MTTNRPARTRAAAAAAAANATAGQLRVLAATLLVCIAAYAGATALLDDAVVAIPFAGCLFVVLLSLLAPALSTVPPRRAA